MQLKAEGQVRVNKRLSDLGMCSRREGDAWIENGWVLVNGEVATMGQLVELTDKIEIQRCYDLGCNVYITKPVDYESFADAIRQLGLFLSVMQAPEII